MKFSEYVLNEVSDIKTGVMRTKGTVGAPGSAVQAAKGIERGAQGDLATTSQRQAVQPYMEILEKILSNPKLKPKFLQLVKLAQTQNATDIIQNQQRAQ